jgi:hypothetical protein
MSKPKMIARSTFYGSKYGVPSFSWCVRESDDTPFAGFMRGLTRKWGATDHWIGSSDCGMTQVHFGTYENRNSFAVAGTAHIESWILGLSSDIPEGYRTKNFKENSQ